MLHITNNNNSITSSIIASYTLVSGLHLDLSGGGITSESDGEGELLHEHGEGAQLPWEDKVEERPQFPQVVLHGRA